MNEITLTINGKKVKGLPGNSIIDVADNYGIKIPTLCHDPCLESIGACRICLVEDEKSGRLLPACVTKISEDLRVLTESEKVINTRKVVIKLILASHPESCIIAAT